MANKPANVVRIRMPERKKKPAPRNKKRRIIEFVLAFVLGACVCAGIMWLVFPGMFGHVKETIEYATSKHGYNPHVGKCVRYPGKGIDYQSQFSAPNDVHLAAAAKVGLEKTPGSREEVEQIKHKMVQIADSKNYVVDPLTHSMPYLCPGAARELDAIGQAWSELLERNDLPHYQFILTSVLRTQDDVGKLRNSGNINASANSAHCFGTTFDITYTRFEKAKKEDRYVPEDNLMLALAQVLLNEQRAGNIYVKYEKKQACFHITSRK